MKIGSKDHQKLLEILERYPDITVSQAALYIKCRSNKGALVTDESRKELLSLRTIAARYLNKLGLFGGI